MRKLRTTARAGHGEDHAFAAAERPRVVHRFVFNGGDRFAGVGDVAVEEGDDFFRRFEDGRLVARAVGRGEVVAGLREDRDGPAGQVGEVIGVPADRVRFGVGLPVELVVGDALEHFARAGHFVVEFGRSVSA